MSNIYFDKFIESLNEKQQDTSVIITGDTTRLTSTNYHFLQGLLDGMMIELMDDVEADTLLEMGVGVLHEDYHRLARIKKQLALNEILLDSYAEDEEGL